MQFLVYAIITSSLCFEYLGTQEYAPKFIAYAQELLALTAVLVVVVAGVQQRFGNVAARYWFVFGSIVVTMLCGILINAVEPGPIFAGLRAYLRAIPFFFLPAVVMFSERQLKAQFVLVIVFAVLQLPISLEQRLTTFDRGYLSGDRTVGTLADSGFLSIFLICVASVMFGFLVRGRLSKKWAVVLLPLILAPTMYNETKASLFLVPLALLVVVVVGATENRMRKFIVATISTALFAAAFVPIYDYFIKPRWGYGIVEFFTMEGRVEECPAGWTRSRCRFVRCRAIHRCWRSASASATSRNPPSGTISPGNTSAATATSCNPGYPSCSGKSGFSAPSWSLRCLGCCSSTRCTSVEATIF